MKINNKHKKVIKGCMNFEFKPTMSFSVSLTVEEIKDLIKHKKSEGLPYDILEKALNERNAIRRI